MAAGINDYFTKLGSPGSATFLAAPGHSIAGTTFNVDSTALFPTDTAVIFGVDTTSIVSGVATRDVGSYTVWRGLVTSGTAITSCTLMYGTDQDYTAGSTTRVYIIPSTPRTNRMIDGLLNSLDQDGTLKAGAVDVTAVLADNVVTKAKVASAVRDYFDKGWIDTLGTTTFPVPDTVTNNGNRSYDLVFNSTDLTDDVSAGQRLRLTRTVSAPTQCADLESGSSQYFNKTSPNKLTFTDDFVCSAWVKLESYTSAFIVSRYNGTSGWGFYLNSSGQVLMTGFNAGASNQSTITSYQSLPLNKWVHVTAQLDMSTFTATTTTSYVMIDGVDVPCSVTRGGTNPTALVQAGNLEIGAGNGGTNPFDGKIAQVAIFNAKVTQATMRGYMSQGLSGSETSLASAYSLSNSITDLNTTTPNDLTAQGGALATNVDSPFGSYLGGTLDYGIITKTAFSTNTTLTVQVPEGCAIPTSGGVSAVAYSTQAIPYLFPKASSRWGILTLIKVEHIQSSPVSNTWYNLTSTSGVTGGNVINVPIGDWTCGYITNLNSGRAGSANGLGQHVTLSTGASTESDVDFSTRTYLAVNSAVDATINISVTAQKPLSISASTPYYLNTKTSIGSGADLRLNINGLTATRIFAEFNLL